MNFDGEIGFGMKIVGAILAAGTSSRMGRNKLLLPYKEHTVFEEVLSLLLKSDLDEVIVVTGFEKERIEELIKNKRKDEIKIVYNEDFKLGRSESIKCAVRNAGDRADALLFMVADKPCVRADLVDRTIAEFKKKSPEILYVKTPEGRGHPIIFSKKLFEELLKLSGDMVGEEIIGRHMDDVLELPDSAVQVDVDTIEDYNILTK
jgi:molybdenum cofactor cytidylyltransferase